MRRSCCARRREEEKCGEGASSEFATTQHHFRNLTQVICILYMFTHYAISFIGDEVEQRKEKRKIEEGIVFSLVVL